VIKNNTAHGYECGCPDCDEYVTGNVTPNATSGGDIQLTVDAYSRLSVRRHLLIHRYPEGDIDVFTWPLDTRYRTREVQLEQIAMAVQDLREMGEIDRDITSIRLPDGTEVPRV
jgi:hypothetical protein